MSRRRGGPSPGRGCCERRRPALFALPWGSARAGRRPWATEQRRESRQPARMVVAGSRSALGGRRRGDEGVVGGRRGAMRAPGTALGSTRRARLPRGGPRDGLSAGVGLDAAGGSALRGSTRPGGLRRRAAAGRVVCGRFRSAAGGAVQAGPPADASPITAEAARPRDRDFARRAPAGPAARGERPGRAADPAQAAAAMGAAPPLRRRRPGAPRRRELRPPEPLSDAQAAMPRRWRPRPPDGPWSVSLTLPQPRRVALRGDDRR